MAASVSPDCTVLDLIMPEMGGIEVLQQLGHQGSHGPVIVLTAGIQETTRAACLELGAVDRGARLGGKPSPKSPACPRTRRNLSVPGGSKSRLGVRGVACYCGDVGALVAGGAGWWWRVDGSMCEPENWPTVRLSRQACLQLSLPGQNHPRYPIRRNLPQAKPGPVQRELGGLAPTLLIKDPPQNLYLDWLRHLRSDQLIRPALSYVFGTPRNRLPDDHIRHPLREMRS